MKRFTAVVEKCTETGLYVGYVPGLPGAHKQFRHPDGRGPTVPVHKGRDISPVLIRKIAEDIGINVMDFISK